MRFLHDRFWNSSQAWDMSSVHKNLGWKLMVNCRYFLGIFNALYVYTCPRLPRLVLKTHSISPGCYLLHFCCQRMWWVVLLVVMSSPGMLWLCWLGSQESALFPHSLQVVFALGWLHTTIRLLASWLKCASANKGIFKNLRFSSGKWWHGDTYKLRSVWCFFFPHQTPVAVLFQETEQSCLFSLPGCRCQ